MKMSNRAQALHDNIAAAKEEFNLCVDYSQASPVASSPFPTPARRSWIFRNRASVAKRKLRGLGLDAVEVAMSDTQGRYQSR